MTAEPVSTSRAQLGSSASITRGRRQRSGSGDPLLLPRKRFSRGSPSPEMAVPGSRASPSGMPLIVVLGGLTEPSRPARPRSLTSVPVHQVELLEERRTPRAGGTPSGPAAVSRLAVEQVLPRHPLSQQSEQVEQHVDLPRPTARAIRACSPTSTSRSTPVRMCNRLSSGRRTSRLTPRRCRRGVIRRPVHGVAVAALDDLVVGAANWSTGSPSVRPSRTSICSPSVSPRVTARSSGQHLQRGPSGAVAGTLDGGHRDHQHIRALRPRSPPWRSSRRTPSCRTEPSTAPWCPGSRRDPDPSPDPRPAPLPDRSRPRAAAEGEAGAGERGRAALDVDLGGARRGEQPNCGPGSASR